jgi:hypothetical protein
MEAHLCALVMEEANAAQSLDVPMLRVEAVKAALNAA